MIVHYGNGNYKRTVSACGNKTDPSDSVDLKKVNCIKCIEDLLKRTKCPTKNTPAWEDRLAELKKAKS